MRYTHMSQTRVYITYMHTYALVLHAYGHHIHECTNTHIHIPLHVCVPSAHIYTLRAHMHMCTHMHACICPEACTLFPSHCLPAQLPITPLKAVAHELY